MPTHPSPNVSSDLSGLLGKVEHFRNLSEKDLRRIVSAGQIRRFQAGSFIFLQDEPCAGMFVLLAGQVHLCKLGPQGQQNIMSIIQPVIMFNEVAVLDGGPNPITALAVQDCVTWQISQADFQDLMQIFPQLGAGLLRVMARRNRLLIAHYEDLSFRTVLARTAKLLLELSEQGKKNISRREHTIDLMAARVAAVREAISRSLHYIKDQGAISLSRTTITVLDPGLLASLAQVDT